MLIFRYFNLDYALGLVGKGQGASISRAEGYFDTQASLSMMVSIKMFISA